MDRFLDSLIGGVLILGTLLTLAWVVDAQANKTAAYESGVEECRALLGVEGHVPLAGLRECERLGVKFFKD